MTKSALLGTKFRAGNLVGWGLLLLGAACMVLPYVVMVSTSTKSESQIFAGTFELLPNSWALIDNYRKALTSVPLVRFLWNGVVVCALILILQLLTAIPCAYALSKIPFRGRDFALSVVLVGLLIPHQISAIPIYVALSTAGLLDTYAALVAPFVTSVFAIFLFRQFFRSIPDDLLNAARVDGLSELSIISRIVLPNAWPAVTAFSIFSIIAHWNDLFWPMVVITNPEMATPPLGVLFFRDQESGGFAGPLMAGTVLITAPLVLAFLFAQRRFIEGIALSGLKG